MKLRIRGNSLRLVVTQSEIIRLLAQGFLENQVQLGPTSADVLTYRLETDPLLMAPDCAYQTGAICVRIPQATAEDWANNKTVGLYSQTDWDLKIAVEKDQSAPVKETLPTLYQPLPLPRATQPALRMHYPQHPILAAN